MAYREWRRRDIYRRLAKEEGKPSRSYYKLREVLDQYRFIPRGGFVIDLGCYPGGWLLAAAEEVGEAGCVVGVDLRETTPPAPNVRTIVGDVREHRVKRELQWLARGRADAVLSDLSPKLSGNWEVDAERTLELAFEALDIAKRCLRRGGAFFVKVFEYPRLAEFERELQRQFVRVIRLIPKATRKGSRELFILALGFRGRRAKRRLLQRARLS